MKYKIYKKSKSAMQSGLHNTKKWCLEPLSITPKKRNSVFSWTSVNGTQDQIKLLFNTLEEAVYFAQKNKVNYQVFKPNVKITRIKSYANNFKPKS
tara:strand:- start:303 stop:590 length:288 start_codon:yes stop_codon:yes gene_type:complete